MTYTLNTLLLEWPWLRHIDLHVYVGRGNVACATDTHHNQQHMHVGKRRLEIWRVTTQNSPLQTTTHDKPTLSRTAPLTPTSFTPGATMDPPPEQQPQATPGSSSNIDEASMHTITASTLQSNNNNPTYDARPQTSYSDTGFSRAYSQSADNTPDRESRPPSASAQGSQYGDNRSKAEKNSSVVIKVGMVGDAQIGKTSLMVKYVEGSWDEDYIQTLGKEILADKASHRQLTSSQASTSWKRPFLSGTPKSLSPSGIWADSASSSTCFP